MARFYLRSGLFLLAAAFCILLGVNLAGGGMEQIGGSQTGKPAAEASAPSAQPMPSAKPADQAKQEAKAKEAEKTKAAYEELKRNRANEGSLFGAIGSAIGSLLSSVASFVISIFTAVFDLFI